MTNISLCLVLFLSCLFSQCHALYSKKSDVQLLTAKSFDKTIKASDQVTIVEFFAPWCGHCKNLAPTYQKLASTLKGMVNVAAIDCDEDSNKSVCGQYGIKGFPTLKVMKPKLNKNGKRAFSVEDYNGERSLKAMAEHVTSIMPSSVQKLTSESIESFLEKENSTAKVLLFTKKGATSSIYKALSTTFGKAVSFGQIRDTHKSAVQSFGIEEFPTLLLLPGGTDAAVKYTGVMKLDAMKNFVSANIGPVGEAHEKDASAVDGSEDSKKARPSPDKPVQHKVLGTVQDFLSNCVGPNVKTSLLTPAPLLSNLSFDSKTKGTDYFEYSTDVAAFLQKEYGIAKDSTIFLNGKKNWFIVSQEPLRSAAELNEFVDKVKQGEAGEKVKIKAAEVKAEL